MLKRYIGSIFKYRHTPYRLRGEGLNLELPNFNLKFKKNSFTYSLTKLWNSLPSQVGLSSDANDFRSKLHDCHVFYMYIFIELFLNLNNVIT